MSNYKYKSITLRLSIQTGNSWWGLFKVKDDDAIGERIWSKSGVIDDVGDTNDASDPITVTVNIKASKDNFGSLAVSSAGAEWSDASDDTDWIQTCLITLEAGIQQEDLKFTVTPTPKDGSSSDSWKNSLDPYVRVRRKGYSFSG